nr:MAG: major capsid protein [Microvirus Sku15]
MANIMQELRLRNKPKRSGFDLTKSIKMTAKVGEATPCGMWFTIPDDNHNFQLSSLTRTVNVNTAAFARMREYYDYYFVPFEVLWSNWGSVITQMKDNVQHAMGLYYDDNETLSLNLPYITCESVARYITKLSGSLTKNYNFFQFKRSLLTVKLLSYLGYPDFSPYLDPKITWDNQPMALNRRLSVFPLLAYQKIYFDHIRFQQWEKANPSCYNIDYIKGTDDLEINILDDKFMNDYNFLDMRYFNYNKDLYFGLLPSPQFGDSSTVNVNSFSSPYSFNVSSGSVSDGQVVKISKSGDDYFLKTDTGYFSPLHLTSPDNGFSILQLRQAEALQRWKEVSQSIDMDYKSQIEAHFGISVSDYLGHKSTWLNGFYGSLDIHPVVNQNLTADNGADLKGYGTIGTNGGFSFNSKDRYGIIMCLYHVTPIFDYCCGNTDPMCYVSHATDFPLPEFDQIGMEAVYSGDLCNFSADDEGERGQVYTWAKKDTLLGYAPRYIRWKTDIDVALGGFANKEKSWVLPFDWKALSDAISPNVRPDLPKPPLGDGLTYHFFKINPRVVDTVFSVSAQDGYDSDHFRVSMTHTHSVTRSLDYNGIPY